MRVKPETEKTKTNWRRSQSWIKSDILILSLIVEKRKSDCNLERGKSWKVIKNKQKGSIRASKGLTRGYGHELLKLIPDVWELSAMSSSGRPTRLRRLQNCKIAILLNKANISLSLYLSHFLHFLLKFQRKVLLAFAISSLVFLWIFK